MGEEMSKSYTIVISRTYTCNEEAEILVQADSLEEAQASALDIANTEPHRFPPQPDDEISIEYYIVGDWEE